MQATRFSNILCLSLSLALIGCISEKGEDGLVAPPMLGSDTGEPGEGPPIQGDSIVLETTRGPIYADYLDFGEFPGLVGVPNLDDDDEDGQSDWSQSGDVSGDNDFALATLQTQDRAVRLELSGAAGIRIYVDSGLIMGDSAGSTYEVMSGSGDVDLRVEYADFMLQGTLQVEDVERGERFDVALTASPLLFNHHLQASKETMSVSVNGPGYSNADMMDDYETVLGDDFFAASGGNYEYDVWIQDEIEFGYATSPDAHLNVIFDTLRDRGLDDFAEDFYEKPGWIIVNWGDFWASSLDAGGNFEVSPPVTVDGVHYPYGRVYYGGAPGYQPAGATQDAVESFQVQKPFIPDSTWLCVGHVDEFTTTIPDPTAPKGFRFVISDTRSGWEVLEGMDHSTALPKYSPGGYAGHSLDSVGEMLEDTALINVNEEVQDILDEQEALFREELGLDDEDILYIFEEVDECGGTVAALIPGMANLVVADVEDQPTIFLADPFLRSDVNDQSTDAMIAEVRARFPESLDLVFMDDWDVYHMMLGEVHCGSNVNRAAPRTWWEDAGHLISQEGGR